MLKAWLYSYIMSGMEQPPTFSLNMSDGNEEKFALWKQRMGIYSLTTGKTGEALVPFILRALDDEALKAYNSFQLTPEQAKVPENIYKKFEELLNISKPNFRAARLDYFYLRQKDTETMDSFYIRCREKARACDFEGQEEKEFFLILLLASTPIAEFQKWLLSQPKTVTLPTVFEEGRKYESQMNNLKHIKERENLQSTSSEGATLHAISQKSKETCCFNCGRSHPKKKEDCPARDSTCRFCDRVGHWERMCFAKKKRESERRKNEGNLTNTSTKKKTSFNEIEQRQEEDYQYDTMTISSVAQQERTEVFTNIRFWLPDKDQNNGIRKNIRRHIKCKVDTGAQGNTMPLRIYKQLYPEDMGTDGLPSKKTRVEAKGIKLRAYNGTDIPCYGQVKLLCNQTDNRTLQTFFVVDVEGPAIAGLPTLEQLGLVTLNCCPIKKMEQIKHVEDLKQRYPELFDKIGNLKGEKARLYLKDDAAPVIDPPRKYAIHLKDQIKMELEKMQQQGVIRPVTEHSDWCCSLTTAQKADGSIRVCLDPRNLNKNLRRCPHKQATVEEITHLFNGTKYFSKLDAYKGYWGVELCEEDQLLTTFRTPFGRYCYQRLPFGLCVSQDLFQQRIDRVIERCEGVAAIADDIVVYGKTEEQHDRNLINLMEIARTSGLTFNSNKCHIKKMEIDFFGQVYTTEGIRPDPRKVEDVQAMPSPRAKTELQQFLGAIGYLSPFIKGLSATAEPIRQLLQKDTPFEWHEDHEHIYNQLKTQISKEALLRYYDVAAPTYLMVDASARGLGAAILQATKDDDGRYSQPIHPVAYASKAMTPGEKNLANIEREMLAVRFGIKRFHTYLCNRRFTVLSDHRPLEMIVRKPLHNAPPRLQSLLLEVQGYDFDIKYTPGAEVSVADALSRLPNPNKTENMRPDIKVTFLKFSETKITSIQEETMRDPILNALKEVIHQGWPATVQELASDLRIFWTYRDELTVEDGLIMKGERIFIPASLRRGILENLHTGHFGISKTQLRARRDVYWPKINQEIEEMCQQCNQCQKFQKSQSKEPLIPTEAPSRPWQVIGIDLFQVHQTQYVMIADYYTKYPVVEELPSPCGSATLTGIVKRYCAIFGKPDIIRSDNGPHFTGHPFTTFTNDWDIEHKTSSPNYARSNGFVERMIGTAKPILTKAIAKMEDIDLALLRWRTTPISNKLSSPAELLFDRRVKDTLPAKQLYQSPKKEDTREELQRRQQKEKEHHDDQARELPPLYPGQEVTIRSPLNNQWEAAQVVERASEPRSYIVSRGGRLIRRNRRDIRSRNVRENIEEPVGVFVPTSALVHQPPVMPQPVVPQTVVPVNPTRTESQSVVSQPPVPVPEPDSAPPGYITSRGRRTKPPEKLDL